MKSFQASMDYLARAERVIPLGSQTFSKSRTQYPYGASPYFIDRGEGARVWDMDGNCYTDFVSSLASITLGYNDPDVTQAVRAQLDDGVIFSLPHRLEAEVAELICEMVPCAEMVRFGKNGSTPPPAPCGSHAPPPAASMSRSAATTAGRTGTSAAPRGTRACRKPCAT